MEKSENYWENCKRMTGAHKGKEGAKIAREIGRDGAWTLKARGDHKILVGCLFREKSEFHETGVTDHEGRPAKHIAVCAHGLIVGASTRRRAIAAARDLAKPKSKCARCRKVSTAETAAT